MILERLDFHHHLLFYLIETIHFQCFVNKNPHYYQKHFLTEFLRSEKNTILYGQSFLLNFTSNFSIKDRHLLFKLLSELYIALSNN